MIQIKKIKLEWILNALFYSWIDCSLVPSVTLIDTLIGKVLFLCYKSRIFILIEYDFDHTYTLELSMFVPDESILFIDIDNNIYAFNKINLT